MGSAILLPTLYLLLDHHADLRHSGEYRNPDHPHVEHANGAIVEAFQCLVKQSPRFSERHADELLLFVW